MGTMPRGLAQSGILDQGASEQEIALAQQEAQNEAMALQQNQQAYEQNPSQYEVDNVLETQDADTIDQAIAGLDGGGQEVFDYEDVSSDMTMNPGGPETLDMTSQEGAMTTGDIQGLTPESAGMYANPNGAM